MDLRWRPWAPPVGSVSTVNAQAFVGMDGRRWLSMTVGEKNDLKKKKKV